MLKHTAIRMLLHERRKYVGVVLGVAMALFLVLLQTGFYFGFRRDITVVGDSVDADLWVSQHDLLAFDYVSHFDNLVQWAVAGDPDVAASMPVIAEWSRIRRQPDGATEDAQVIGLDLSAGVSVNLGGIRDADLIPLLSVPGNVLVDEKHLGRLGLSGPGETGVELRGLNVNVIGLMRDKKLFSTACLVVTDLDNARRFLGLSPDRITFIAIKCRRGANLMEVRTRLQAHLSDNRVWTATEFYNLTQDYWVRLTGIGPVLLLSAGLAAMVGFITVFLTFSHLTAEKLPVYAAMKAMGASTVELGSVILLQIGAVFSLGCVLAGTAVLVALTALARTTISVVLTPGICTLGIGLMALFSLAAGARSIRQLATLDPAEAFRT